MIYLRKATYEDMETLFNWANDIEVRKNSFNQNLINLENHIKWFNNKLKDDDSYIFIIYDDEGNDIGQFRVDVENKIGLIDYSVDKKYRGLGIGKNILILIKEKFKDIVLIGRVKYNNISSIKSFENAGFKRFDKDNHIEFISK